MWAVRSVTADLVLLLRTCACGLACSKNEFTKEALFKSICLMQVPTQLLKFGSSGKPGFRYFQLTEDLRSLTWQSKNKAAANTKVDLSVIKEIKYGQRTEKFKRNNRPDLEHLSFSLIYGMSASLFLSVLRRPPLTCTSPHATPVMIRR